MIGVYDYTVILTYLSLLSAGAGVIVSLSGKGHPYIGIFLLLFCGLCDAFDGKVASTKKNRTDLQRKFGIQIDSLSDLVAFGVLPCCIGGAFIRRCNYLMDENNVANGAADANEIIKVIFLCLLVLYILAALIRLAYFNVTEEERQQAEGGRRKYFLGLPVTSASIIFPTAALVQYITKSDLTWVYVAATVITGVLFITPFKMRKPGMRGILLMIAVGLTECILFIVTYMMRAY